jgi:nucleoside 2-deoxyribosyltransferase
MHDATCSIWQTPARKTTTLGDPTIDSARTGGPYTVTATAAKILESWQVHDKVKLTSWLIEQRRLGIKKPEITSDILTEIQEKLPSSIQYRTDALLRYISSKSDLLGTVISFRTFENQKNLQNVNELLAWTGSRQLSEVITIAEYCNQEGWIEHRNTPAPSGDATHELMLRPPGYAYLLELDRTNSGSKQAFVAMWFNDDVQEAYEHGIAPAIRDAGYDPMRIDKKQHNEKIDDQIIAEIRRSRFLVADFTQGSDGARGGVYYEAGFAHGLNIPVVFTCRSDVVNNLHFDTRQYNHITWQTPEDLRDQLATRISATIGDGPKRK